MLLLDSANHLVAQRVVYQGNISQVMVRIAEVLRPAIVEAVPSLIMVHNHPSGDPNPARPMSPLPRRSTGARRCSDSTPRPRRHQQAGFVSFKDRGIIPCQL